MTLERVAFAQAENIKVILFNGSSLIVLAR